MAKLYTLGEHVYQLFIIFLFISTVLTIDDYYFYKLDNNVNHIRRSEYSLNIEHEGRLQKRDISGSAPSSDYSIANSTETKVVTDLSSTTAKPSVTPVPVYNVDTQNKQLTRLNRTMQETLTHNQTKASSNKRKIVAKTNVNIDPASKNISNNNNNNNNNSINNSNNNSTEDCNTDTEGCSIESEEVDVDEQAFNKTLSRHNITISKFDNHIYYNSTLNNNESVGRHYWVDLSNRSDVIVNELLSKSHRRAATVKLSFDFPFYGHLIKNVTIATGGFLYTGEYIHSWLAATQYIAPLMANFDTSLSNDSCIKYVDNGTAFTVQWEKVTLQDNPHKGEFTFQATLHKNGDIVFVYQQVPLFIEKIDDGHHPVKVGLSDAYIIDKTIFFVRRKTIYEYHRINFVKEDIKNWTSIYLKALPTCLDSKDCSTCLSRSIDSINCTWCPSTRRCSNGLDRHRQEWLAKNCEKRAFSNESLCSHIKSSDIFDNSDMTYSHDVNEFNHKMGYPKTSANNYKDAAIVSQPVNNLGVPGIVAIIFLICSISGLALWTLYAYRNPHTTSGQILIRYRPSQWRWKRGEARYTAATIHM